MDAMEIEVDVASVLLATVKTSRRTTSWATVAATGKEAVTLWERHRYPTVFCDFGALNDGITGPRLARTIRKRCGTTRVFLLSDSLSADQVQWGVANGATAVIRRTVAAISECLPCDEPTLPLAELPSTFPANEHPEAVAKAVAAALARYIGPAASVEVDDAMDVLTRSASGLPPCATDVAKMVCTHVPEGYDRSRFLNMFGANE
jgi:CheY-like chemotaxis protein